MTLLYKDFTVLAYRVAIGCSQSPCELKTHKPVAKKFKIGLYLRGKAFFTMEPSVGSMDINERLLEPIETYVMNEVP